MKKTFRSAAISRKMVLVGIGLGAAVWVADAFWDTVVGQKGGFAAQFLSPAPRELSIRFLTSFIFIGFGMYSSSLVEQTRRSEEQRRASEERYRDLFENANDLIQSVSPEGRFLYVNRAWRDTLGYTEEDLRH